MTHDEAVKTLEQFLEYDRDAVSGWTIGHAQDAIRELLDENENLSNVAMIETESRLKLEAENESLRAKIEAALEALRHQPKPTFDGDNERDAYAFGWDDCAGAAERALMRGIKHYDGCPCGTCAAGMSPGQKPTRPIAEALRGKAENKRLRAAMRFVEEVSRLGDPPEGPEEILSDPDYWATEYAHALKQLSGLVEENERLRAKVSDTEDTIDRADKHTEMLMRKIEKLEVENDRLRAVREGTMKPTETPDGLYAKTADMMEPALKPKVPDLKAAVERAQIKFTFEQRQRLTEEIEPACADDPEYAATEILRLEIERDRALSLLRGLAEIQEGGAEAYTKLQAENERLQAKVSDTEDTIDRADKHTEMLMRKIEKLVEKNQRLQERDRLRQTDYQAVVDENERLRAQIKGRTLVPELVEKDREVARLKACIEAVEALCDSVDRPGGDRLVTIESVRKALKGDRG